MAAPYDLTDFFDASEDPLPAVNQNTPKPKNRRPSDVGSIHLSALSLETIGGAGTDAPNNRNGLARSNTTTSADKSTGYHSAMSNDPDDQHRNGANGSSNEVLQDFLKDNPKDMTYGRRIALWLMDRFACYNPQLNDTKKGSAKGDEIVDGGRFRSEDGYPLTHSKEEPASLKKAWAYFDHVALPRYMFVPKENPNEKKNIFTRIIRKFSKANKQLQRAEPGEAGKPTRLYSPVFTPHKQLGDFGLGIGLYFSTLRALTVLVFICGLINIPNFMYFSGDKYSNNQIKPDGTEVDTIVRGSAICTVYEWVACPSCTLNQFDHKSIAFDVERNLTFARKNLCDGATLEQGMVNFICLVFVIVGLLGLSFYLKRMEVQFDEDEQTAQDYSIQISNPPEDATDPEEWRKFFLEAFDAHVTGCTVAVDNDLLVKTLVERREKMRMLELMLEPGTGLDMVTLAGIAAKAERGRTFFQHVMAYLSPGTPEIFARMAVLTAKVQGLAQQDYPVTNVFVTFETEAGQRRVLEKLTVGQMAIDTNRKAALSDEKYLFRGFRVLAIREPEEPDTIRWDDLNVGLKQLLKQQFFTTIATFVAVVVVALIVNIVNNTSEFLTSYVIAISNAIFPMFAKFLTYNEDHGSHGSLQTSLYFKIALFRWVTTAIVITIITPFTDTLSAGSGGLITQVKAQFMAEVTTTAAIQLLDPVGHLQRHVFAPRARTQDAMNLKMQGSPFELAERYTASAKLLFLTFWYCALFPGGFFFCAFNLTVIYFLDRFSLMRTWKRPPRLGATISQFNRSYFLPLSALAMAIFSSYWWSGFPFDNLCEDSGNQVPESYIGGHNVKRYEGVTSLTDASVGGLNATQSKFIGWANTTIEPGERTYFYCVQDFLRVRGRQTFPFVSRFQKEGEEWMTDEQETVTTIYGWSAFALLLLFLLYITLMIINGLYNYFKGSYQPTGDDQGLNFSDVDAINLYIPQVESQVFSYPLLACNVDNIDKDMLDWTDPEHPHAFYDLTKDAQALIRGTDISRKVVFSQVAHWPPTDKGVN